MTTRAQTPDPVSAALTTLFSPDRAPENRTMGLVQRNFLDLVEATKPKLQIALVVDGTSSMDSTLSGIKSTLAQMISDIELYGKTDVSYQLVVFRDSGSPSGEIVLPLGSTDFVSDRDRLQEAVDSIQAESGAPFFPELVDSGIHTALTKLNWSMDEDTTKWLLLLGDAPPYDVGFDDEPTGARRRFETNHLAGLAATRGIKINCVLCASRETEREAFDAVLEKTQDFMSTLSTETGGLMLDLSYEDIRKSLVIAAQKPRAKSIGIGQITQAEIDALRLEAEEQKSLLSPDRRVSIAVLPHMPLQNMTFNPDRPEVRVAADMRQRFRNLSGVDVQSSRNVIRHFERLRQRGVDDQVLVQMLAATLKVDYVVWGETDTSENLVQVSSGLYGRLDGMPIAIGQSGAESKISDATTLALRQVVSQVRGGPLTPMKAALERVVGSTNADSIQLTPVSNDSEVFDALTTAYESLEQAASLQADDSNATPLLEKARNELKRAIAQDGRTPLPYWLLANCLYNEAQVAMNNRNEASATAKFAEAKQNLREAKRRRGQSTNSDLFRTEIDADYELLGLGRPKEAIAFYEQLTQASTDSSSKIQMHQALRAHWMLAGIYSGDWGSNEVVDIEKARLHLKNILAYWPQSEEAEFVRSKLRWDTQAGKTQFQHLPEHNKPLVDLFP